jgi:hypothetical protein
MSQVGNKCSISGLPVFIVIVIGGAPWLYESVRLLGSTDNARHLPITFKEIVQKHQLLEDKLAICLSPDHQN